MKQSLTLLIAQINSKVGDIESNTQQMIELIKNQQAQHDIIIFPELALSGYPPEDLLLHPSFHSQIEKALNKIRHITQQCYVVVGHPHHTGKHLLNRASVFYQQQLIFTYDKYHLPNYGVFDEKRYFTPGPLQAKTMLIKGHQVGICICEDLWQAGPVEKHLDHQTDLLLLINASPFDVEKAARREARLKHYAKQGIALVYVNLIGGQDELVFDGQSLVLDANAKLCARLPAFEASNHTIHYYSKDNIIGHLTPPYTQEASIYQALCLGLRDYVHKNGFQKVLLGLSGGIDSALTLAIATDALGPEQVHVVSMPSRYTAEMSNEDALAQARLLGVHIDSLPIEPIFETILTSLDPVFNGQPMDLTEENIQARIRGLLLMAISNKTGKLLLTTSNKSEASVGYATLYGDMCGGFGVLKDLFKTEVFQLAKYRNQINEIIPKRVLERPPSAELRFDQTDQDHLPDYQILDQILLLFIEKKQSASQIIKQGFDEETVHRVLSLLSKNEYKRKQAAPGVKISSCAFGKDWRYPITSGFELQ